MSLRSTTLSSPPRASLAFRVGVVGHRPNRLPKDKESLETLRDMLRIILEEIKMEVSNYADSSPIGGPYSPGPFILRAVSPLAEGADRLFANEAIDLGYELLCPMPFSQDEFERDFLPPAALETDSREHFRSLLSRARQGAGVTTFELDGDRSAATDAYSLCGRIVLNQSDLLIAVWDGRKPAGDGSTVDTALEAIGFQVPVLWIDALAPHHWQLLRNPDEMKFLDGKERRLPQGTCPADPAEARKLIAEAVRRIVREEIALPESPSDTHQTSTAESHAARYFRENRPRTNFAIAWKLFRDAVGSGRIRPPSIVVSDFEADVREAWPIRDDAADKASASGAGQQSDLENWVNQRLRAHFAWPDKRGDLYADAYRSGYVLTYLLSAMAVLVALLPMAAGFEGQARTICVVTEFAMLIVILLLFVIGRKRQWYERWMEYRLLAEMIRQLRVLIPLGGGRPLPRTPTHLGLYGSLTQTWMYWHTRAIARATGIPQAKVKPEYLLDCLSYIDELVGKTKGGQFQFQKDTEIRTEHIAHRLHKTSTYLFGITLLGIGTHLLLEVTGSGSLPHWLEFHIPEPFHKALDQWLVLASAFLPALAAALAGINNQGEFARLAKRSAAMADSFSRFAVRIAALRSANADGSDALKLSHLIPLAGEIAEVMVEEVADWRVVFTDRPPVAA
jgi:hypothetical protein